MPISPRPPSATKTNSSAPFICGILADLSAACGAIALGRGCGVTRQEHIAGFDRLRLVALAQYQPAAAVDPLEDAQNAGRSQRHANGLAKTERVCEPALTNFRKAGALRPNLQHLRHRVAEARQ